MSTPPKSETPEQGHRVVIRTDPALYRSLKSKLALAGMTVRAWFEAKAKEEVSEK
jgi:hypothetical protein